MVPIIALKKVTFVAGVGFRSPQHPLRARVVAGSSTDTNNPARLLYRRKGL